LRCRSEHAKRLGIDTRAAAVCGEVRVFSLNIPKPLSLW
jgi:hypothetical protein